MQQNDKPQPRRGGRPRKYPWLELDVGDSFMVEGKDAFDMSRQKAYAQKRYGLKLTARTVIRHGQKCCWITRIA